MESSPNYSALLQLLKYMLKYMAHAALIHEQYFPWEYSAMSILKWMKSSFVLLNYLLVATCYVLQ